MLAYLTCLNREFVTIIINHLRTMLLARKQKKIYLPIDLLWDVHLLSLY